MRIVSALLYLAALVFPTSAFCAPPAYAPRPISARFNVRYSYALGKKAETSIGKDHMATTDRFDLPEAKPVVKGAAAESTIQGSVKGLPFEFYLRFTRTSEIDAGLLEVNAIDLKTNQTLPGFPRKIVHAYLDAEQDDGIITVDLKLTKAQSAILEEWLRANLKESGERAQGRLVVDAPFLLVVLGRMP